jgi:hypothetical protein
MNSDCAFRMGRSHTVCEDYAVAGGGEQPYVVIADGCSSSPDTDIGGRLLAKGVERSLRAGAPDLDLRQLVRRAGKLAAHLGLAAHCLDATLLTATVQGDQWSVSVFGDGVVAWHDVEGRVHVRVISYSGGYPEYPSYLASPARRRGWEALAGNQASLRRITVDLDGGIEALSEERLSPGGYRESGDVRETTWVALLSDGAASFMASRTEGGSASVDVAVVLAELLRFKSFQGVFVQRRLARFAQQCAVRGWCHQDDLSLGAIYLGA